MAGYTEVDLPKEKKKKKEGEGGLLGHTKINRGECGEDLYCFALCVDLFTANKMTIWEKKREVAGEELAALRIQLLTPCQCTHFNLEFQAVTDY